jgi:SAM-dependent methyltransferase
MSDYSSTHTRSLWDHHADPTQLRDMARCIWGSDVEASMRHWSPGPLELIKYQRNIVDHQRALAGKRVLDLGCNNGLWSYMALRHGASHVVGVEPRGMFVRGLNEFAQAHSLPMEFHRGHDGDLARLVREHDIDTVIMISVDSMIPWQEALYRICGSNAEWVIMQMSTIPDTWVDFTAAVRDYAKSGKGMPVGFTLHFDGHNSTMKSGMNPMHKDTADPETGYQHMTPDGRLDVGSTHFFDNKMSRQYVRRFIEHTGLSVESSKVQDVEMPEAVEISPRHGLTQWYLLQNKK